MSEQPKSQSELAENLALDELTDAEKRKQVEAYFEGKKQEISDVAKGKRGKLQEVMREMNRTKAGPDKIIEAILAELFQGALERDVSGRYAELFHTVLDEVGVDLEGDDKDRNNPVRKKAMAIALTAIQQQVRAEEQKAKKFMNRQYVHEFAEALIRDYVKKMDDKAETFKWGVLHENELKEKGMEPMTFSDWIGVPPRYSEKQLFMELSPTEAKRFVGDIAGVKQELAKVKPEAAGLDKRLSDFFKAEAARIEGEAISQPGNLQPSLEAAAVLAAAFASAMKLSTFKGDVEARLNDAAGLKDKLPDFDASIEQGYHNLLSDVEASTKAFLEKKGAGDVVLKTKEKQELDKKLDAEKKRAEESAAKTAEEEKAKEEAGPNPLEDPEGFLQHIFKDHPILTAVFGFFGFDKIFTKFLNSPKVKKLQNVLKYKGKSQAEIERIGKEVMPKYVAFMEKEFEIKKEPAEEISLMDVSDFMKLTRSPKGVDQKPFEAFQKALESNGATKTTSGLLIDFMEKNMKEWKASGETPATGEPPEKPAQEPPKPEPAGEQPEEQAPATEPPKKPSPATEPAEEPQEPPKPEV